MTPKNSIIILNWNGGKETVECLRSLNKIDYPDYEVIVVDNASDDGSPDEIARLFPGVTLIRNKQNLGFDGGNNVGILDALKRGADAVLLLNNDTEVAGNILSALAAAAAELPRAGILGPAIYYHDNPSVFWWNGCRKKFSDTGWLFDYTQEGKQKAFSGYSGGARKIDAVIGCAMYIKRTVFDEIGLLDDRFFIYQEEYDFCQRAAESNWDCYLVPEAKVWHKVSRSMGGQYSPSLYYFWTRNWLLLSRKHANFFLWPFVYYAYLKEGLWVYQGLREKGRIQTAEAALSGLWNAFLNRFGQARSLKPPRILSAVADWHYRRNCG